MTPYQNKGQPSGRSFFVFLSETGKALQGDSVPLRSTLAPPIVWLVHFVNGQTTGPSPTLCGGGQAPGSAFPASSPCRIRPGAALTEKRHSKGFWMSRRPGFSPFSRKTLPRRQKKCILQHSRCQGGNHKQPDLERDPVAWCYWPLRRCDRDVGGNRFLIGGTRNLIVPRF